MCITDSWTEKVVIRITKTTQILLRYLWIFFSLKYCPGITGVLFNLSWMSLVLANITSLWKQIFTNVMQSPLSSLILFQSHSALTAGTALITVHHTPHCLASSPCFLKNACTYLCIFHSLSFQNGHGPQGRDHPLQCAVLPLYWFLQMQLRENSHQLFLPRRGDLSWTRFQLSAESWEIRWPPQEPGWKGTAETCSLFPPSVHWPFTALDAGK